MTYRIPFVFFCLIWSVACFSANRPLNESAALMTDLQQKSADSQKRIDRMADQTEAMLEEYRQLLLDVDYHQTHLQQLTSQLQQQQQTRQQLQQQIEQIQLTEKRLAPLLASMVQTLERFVVLDLPFHRQERIDAALLLRERVQDTQLPLVDRFQLVVEAFQIELEYGSTLEAYRQQLTWQGELRSVDCLRVGRLALYFMTPDGALAGYWDKQAEQWQPLSPDYLPAIREGLSVARNQLAPKLLTLPVVAEVVP